MPADRHGKLSFEVFKRPHLCAEALRCAGTRAYTTDFFQNAKVLRFRLEFIPIKIGAGMTNNQEICPLSDHQALKLALKPQWGVVKAGATRNRGEG